MSWYHYLAHFFCGAFLANFVPHFVAGVSGRSMPTPFANPPFRGLSSPLVNLLWGLCNLGVAYVLLVLGGDLALQDPLHIAIAGAGFALVSIALARKLRRLPRGET